ncbi:MAG: transglutaminase domain-containing protein [Coriobacteriia bacterium]|nr:transglutaminase domain-containing protein [Coriobacteriia bacterium]
MIGALLGVKALRPFVSPRAMLYCSSSSLFSFFIVAFAMFGTWNIFFGESIRIGTPLDSTPVVLEPFAAGVDLSYTATCVIDASNAQDGYVMVAYMGASDSAKLQIACHCNQSVYTYNLPYSTEHLAFPFSSGSGIYTVTIFEPDPQLGEDMHNPVLSKVIEVALFDELSPFLYPNHLVWFTPDTQAIEGSAGIFANARSERHVVVDAYNFVLNNIEIDLEMANDETKSGSHSRNIDVIVEEGKGTCLEYAVLLTALLRSQQVPAKLVFGDTPGGYHAWVSAYIRGFGWVLLDPANEASTSLKRQLIYKEDLVF